MTQKESNSYTKIGILHKFRWFIMSDGPSFVGIKFCPEWYNFFIVASIIARNGFSNNMLYPREDKENRQLLYACRNCEHAQIADNPCIYVNKLNHEVECVFTFILFSNTNVIALASWHKSLQTWCTIRHCRRPKSILVRSVATMKRYFSKRSRNEQRFGLNLYGLFSLNTYFCRRKCVSITFALNQPVRTVGRIRWKNELFAYVFFCFFLVE